MDSLNARAKRNGNLKTKVISSRLKQSALHSSKLKLDSNKGSLNFSTRNLSDSCEKTNSFDGQKPKARIVSSRYKSTLNLDVGKRDTNLSGSRDHSRSKNLSTGSDGSSAKACLMDKNSPNPGVGVLSSTMLGGNKSLLQTGFHLPELPDISQICPPTCVSKKNSAGVKKLSITEEYEILPKMEVLSQKDVDVSYLSYLTWAYLDISAEKQHQSHIREAKNQFMYLSSVINETKELIVEEKKLLYIVNWFERVSMFYEKLKGLLDPLVDSAHSWELKLKNLRNQLENQLCQVKLNNIFIPEDQIQYREYFNKALEDMFVLLTKLNSELSPKNDYLFDAKEQLENLLDQINLTRRYCGQVERTAAAIVEEASLQLTANSMQLSENFA